MEFCPRYNLKCKPRTLFPVVYVSRREHALHKSLFEDVNDTPDLAAICIYVTMHMYVYDYISVNLLHIYVCTVIYQYTLPQALRE